MAALTATPGGIEALAGCRKPFGLSAVVPVLLAIEFAFGGL